MSIYPPSTGRNIVKLIDVVELDAAVYIVLERIEGPDLSELILSQSSGRLPEAQARRAARPRARYPRPRRPSSSAGPRRRTRLP